MSSSHPVSSKAGRTGLVLAALGLLGILYLCFITGPFVRDMAARSRLHAADALGPVAVGLLTLLVLGLCLPFLVRFYRPGGQGSPSTEGQPPLGWLRAWWSLLTLVLGTAVINGIAWGLYFAFFPPLALTTENFGVGIELFARNSLIAIAGGVLLAGLAWWKQAFGPKLAVILVTLTIAVILGYGFFGLWLMRHGTP